jgi:hypothetical protein
MSYFLFSSLVMGGLPDRHRTGAQKIIEVESVAGAAHDTAKHARNCGANKNARAERRLVVKDGQQQSSIRQVITKEVGLCGR